ncbi:arylsulfatase [Sphingobacterium phlebotomi]|uniref:arylsulfatase n=1 Tax=Sphingobacterium phlebotomi TaxID=2605433 RepID=UPI001CA31C2A|nr:arylsulfatase [Sphingobacterium phlebotomi]
MRFTFWILAAGMLFSAYAAVGQVVPADRPNIILIMADDMGYADLGCYGSEIHTPNLDQLAGDGLQFRSFYNATRCCPSRAALLTGLYPHEAGMGKMVSNAGSTPKPGPYQGFLNEQSVTLAEVLKEAGYKTYMAGKWHVGERPEHWPRQRGFDHYFGLISGASSYFELVEEPRKRQMVHEDELWFPPTENFYMTDAFTDTALSFLEKHNRKEQDKPFFLYLAYTAPHWPLHALEEDIERYDGMYDKGWEHIRRQRYERMQKLGIIDGRHKLSASPTEIPRWESLDNPVAWADRMEVYAAMVDRMDQGIGRIVATLKKQGKLNNTLIVFLSDNGASAENIDGRKLHDPCAKVGRPGSYLAYDEPWANVSNTPYRKYKSWTEEGGIITPFIVHWPDGTHKRQHHQTNAVGHITDIMPTCIDIAGANYPEKFKGHAIKNMRGVSLLPVFKGDTGAERILYWEHFGKWAIRDGDWKLVGGDADGNVRLFNMQDDPVEQHDLSQQEPAMVDKMKRAYDNWAMGVGVED